MSHADPAQMLAPLTAGVETHRGLEMLDRHVCLTGEQAEPAAPVPGKGEARVQRESAIDHSQSGSDILAEAPEHHGGAAENTRVVGGDAQGLAGKINRRAAVFLLLLVIDPI